MYLILLIILLSVLSWFQNKEIEKIKYKNELFNTRISLLEEQVYENKEKSPSN